MSVRTTADLRSKTPLRSRRVARTEGFAATGNTCWMTRLGIVACVSIGCADPVALPPVPELVRAVDQNADPAIVEVRLAATASSDGLAYRDASLAGSLGTVPGPLIEARRGDRLIVHFTNELADRSTTVHWHGLRLPIEMDGDPTVSGAVPPGGTFDYDIALVDAGLFWYHPHVETDEQIELGLQGPLLVHDPDEPAVDADRVFVLDDIDRDDDGAIRIAPSRDDLMLGRRGDTVLVNGGPPGTIAARPGALERWRLVNTSNGRFFDLALAGRALHVIGGDGGLVPAPYDAEHLPIAPGERYDVLVIVDAPVSLATREVDRGDGVVDAGAELVRVELAGEPVPPRALPATSGDVPPLAPGPQVRQFRLAEDLDGAAGAVFFINDERWPFNNPIDVALGTTERWELVNDNDHAHPFHIHGHFVQVLDQPALGWKDTVAVPARSMVQVAIQYAAAGKWMAHCQIPEHAERGMTADVNVIP
jgi:FtsP/CotA-like multicopper oxidase with cupredoxin domain